MPCTDCFRNCDPIISDRCVQYTGPTIACLDICAGDTLYMVEAQIAEKLCAAMDGTGIDLSDVDITCEFLTDILGDEDPTLFNLMQMLVTASCTLKELIDLINDQINAPFVFDTACLTGTLTTRDEIIQAVITKLCSIDARLTLVESDYVKASDLCTLVQACITTPSSQYNLRMVPYVVYPYVGPLYNFDNTGAGISALNFDKVYLCNGLNNTQDWRGRSAIGAINNVPGGAFDPQIDPSISGNVNYTLNQKVGTPNVTLSLTQIPAHTHAVNDPGHRHSSAFSQQMRPCGSACTPNIEPGSGINTSVATTGITIGSAGSSQPHTNLQPSIAVYYIIYIP